MTTDRTVELSRFWCPICRVPVASVTVRTVHTGPAGELVRNHHNRVLIAGRYRTVHHTVVARAGVTTQ